MKQELSPVIAVLVALFVLTLSGLVVRAAGGRIEGKVTDQKGAAIVGATVRVTDPVTNQTYTAITNAQGQYNVEVDEGAAAPGDVRLEIAAVEAAVNVPTSGLKPNADPVYQQLRQQAKADQEFAGPFASVSNLILKRDAATFTLKSGEIYFVTPIEGRITGGVFIGEGHMNLVAPTENEKRGLQLFTDEPSI